MNKQKPQNGSGKNKSRDIGFYILLAAIIIAVIFTISGEEQPNTLKNYSELVSLFENHKVQSFKTEGNDIILQVRTADNKLEEKYYSLYSFSVFYEDFHDTILEQYKEGIIESYDYTEGFVMPWWASFVPYLLIMFGAMALWFFMMNKSGGGGAGGFMKFSKARTKVADESDRKTFKDVAGCDEEKEELQEIVDFLKDPKKFTDMGARIPKGVLLVGPPGNGKTLLAKAVAGEANVQFLSISGSDFVELYVGVGAGRVRDLFEQAKKVAPSIIFIDEIDAVGRQRGSGLGGGNDEREQTLNQLLVEMDGFTSNDGVIVMAATNRVDILDNALLRPGRFDRQIFVGLPDIKGREEILKIYAKDKKLARDVDLNSIAKGTPGFSGADLENLMNEAAILAVRRDSKTISQADIDEAILKVQLGPEKKSKKMSDRARKLSAYHESGHAISGNYLKHCDPIHYITIIPRGFTGGMTVSRPEEDLENFRSREEMYDNIVMALGGRCAEKLFLDDISTGASGDIQHATSVARDMVTRFGMSDKLGPIMYDSSDRSIFIGRDFGTTKSYSEVTAALIDSEVKAIFDKASAECEKILSDHKKEVIDIAEYLLENEKIDEDDLKYYFDNGSFMTDEQRKLLRIAKNDKSVEKPAKKIARFDEDNSKSVNASDGIADDSDNK